MASEETSSLKARFELLSKGAYLDVLLPRSTDTNVSEILRNATPEELARIPARRNLFFDEHATLNLVLKTPAPPVDIRDLLPSLEITISAYATDAVPQDSGNKASASGKHDVSSSTISASEVADLVSVGEHIYVLWKPTLHLPRPRARLHRPAVYFTVHLTLSSKAMTSSNLHKSERLKSFEPLPANVLEPLRFDPGLRDSNIHLSETRITKVTTTANRPHNDLKPIRGASKRAFPIVPALFTRIRYSGIPDAMVASLHLETTQLVNGKVNINNIALDAPDAKVRSLCQLKLPMESRPGDETVLLYKLEPSDARAIPSSSTVFVRIDGSVSLNDYSHTDLDIKWQAQVDLSHVSAKPTYKWSRPLSGTKQLPVRPLSEGSVRPPSIEVNQETASENSGITFSFSGAPTVIRNEDFRLDVQCINRGNRPRRFAIVVLQPKWAQAKHEALQQEDADLIASLFNAAPLERERPPDVLDLNPDVRIGPLPPGACFEVQMKFRALASGILDLGIIRIVELDTRQTVDVKELPDIMSIDRVSHDKESLKDNSTDPVKHNTIVIL